MIAPARAVRLAAVVAVAALVGCAEPAPPTGPNVVAVPGHPFATVELDDGTLLASVTRDGGHGAILVLRPANQSFAVARSFPVPGRAFGLAASRNGRLVAVAADTETLLLDRKRLETGRGGDPVVARVRNQAQAIEAAFSPDDRLLAISEERARRVMLLPTTADGGAPDEVDVGLAPVGMVFSPDGRRLFVASESSGRGGGCPDAQGRNDAGPGTVSVIALEPGSSPRLAGTVPVGCSPVRIASTADGRRVFLSLRGDDRVTIYDGAALRAGRAAPVGTVQAGPAPVGLALSADGATLLVAASDRFEPGEAGHVTCFAISNDGTMRPTGTVASGIFPRELTRLRDGRMVLTVFGSDVLQVLPGHC